MVDTIRCQSELDLTKNFFEKLLLGAIDGRWDREEIDVHDPAEHGQDAYHGIPHRPKASSTDRTERPWSEAETLVGSSRRGNSFQPNRSSTMPTRVESPVETAQSAPSFEGNPSNMTSFRHASPPSNPLRRSTNTNSTIEEAQEPESRTPQRSSTSDTHSSRWWRLRGS